MITDLDILQKYDRSRDPDAFNQLVARHAAMVYAAAFRVTRNAADADDVTQECFLELVRQAARVRTSVAGWLHLTATHRARDLLRRSSARQRAAHAATPSGTDLDHAAWRDIAPLLDQALAELPDDLRIPVIYHYLEGRTHSEIADDLGISRSTIHRRIDEGLKALRLSLRQRDAAEAPELGMLLAAWSQVTLPAGVKIGLTKIALAGMGTAVTTLSHATARASPAAVTVITIGTSIAAIAILGGAALVIRSGLHPAASPASTPPPTRAAASLPALPPPPAPIKGTWANVTPPTLDLAPSIAAVGDSYGVQDVLADPVHPGTFYAFSCYQGCWKSVDWGRTWTHVSHDGQLEHGKPWSEAIAPDGSYLLACTGGYRHRGGGAWKSTDGGATWTTRGIAGNDEEAYSIDIDATDRRHVIAAIGDGERIFESRDAGETWSERTSPHAGRGAYVFFLTSSSWLAVGQDGENRGTRRSMDSGRSWDTVGAMEHLSGQEQILIDTVSHAVYVPARSGIYRSTDGAASFSAVSPYGASTICATEGRLFAQFAWGSIAGALPGPQAATRGDGRDWMPVAVPVGMTNGAKRIAAARDPDTGAWTIISGNWLAGIWRYTEP